MDNLQGSPESMARRHLLRKCGRLWFLVSCLLLALGLPAAQAQVPVRLTPAQRAWITAHPTVRVGLSVESPPYYFAAGKARYEGFVIEFMDRVAQRVGLKLEYTRYDRFDEVLAAMQQDRIELTPFTAETPERAEFLRFVRPLFSTQMVVVADRRLGDVSSDSDLTPYRVAVERGSGESVLMKKRFPQVKLVEYDHVEKALIGVAAGEADVFVGLRQVAAYYMEKHLTANLVMRGTLASPGTALGPAVRKNLPELAGILDFAIQDMSIEEISDIASRWLPRSTLAPSGAGTAKLSPAQRQWVQRNSAVRLGFDENFSPIAFKTLGGGFDGLAADLTRALAEKVGLVIAYERGSSFSDVYSSALTGGIDIVVAAARNTERSRDFDFVGPFLRVPTVVVAALDRESEVGLDRLGRAKLALLRGHFLMPMLHSRYPSLELGRVNTIADLI